MNTASSVLNGHTLAAIATGVESEAPAHIAISSGGGRLSYDTRPDRAENVWDGTMAIWQRERSNGKVGACTIWPFVIMMTGDRTASVEHVCVYKSKVEFETEVGSRRRYANSIEIVQWYNRCRTSMSQVNNRAAYLPHENQPDFFFSGGGL